MVLIARGTADTVAALERTDHELARIAKAARERTLAEHTSDHRAGELEQALSGLRTREARYREMVGEAHPT